MMIVPSGGWTGRLHPERPGLSASITCRKCRKELMLHAYTIDAVGMVSPTVLCLCGETIGDVRLSGWPPEIDYDH